MEITFILLFLAAVDFLKALEPGEVPDNAASIQILPGLVELGAAVRHGGIGLAQGLFQKVSAELLPQDTAQIIHGVPGLSMIPNCLLARELLPADIGVVIGIVPA